jgi:hypothetical protein
MKTYAMFAALSLFSVFASANEPSGASSTIPAPVNYSYSQNLDIAKVIQVTEDSAKTCGPVKAHMLYLDSKGVEHNLQYTRVSDGIGCENG